MSTVVYTFRYKVFMSTEIINGKYVRHQLQLLLLNDCKQRHCKVVRTWERPHVRHRSPCRKREDNSRFQVDRVHFIAWARSLALFLLSPSLFFSLHSYPSQFLHFLLCPLSRITPWLSSFPECSGSRLLWSWAITSIRLCYAMQKKRSNKKKPRGSTPAIANWMILHKFSRFCSHTLWAVSTGRRWVLD